MAHNVKFDYDSYTDKLIVDADGERNVFLLNDKGGKLFKYILQAIDDLDSGSASINADWDEDDPTSKSYIKNRSSYIDRTYSESAGFSFKCGAGSAEISLPRTIQKDYLYNISVDYETYVGLQFIPGTDLDGNTFYYCGNPKLDSSLNTLGETEYPFFVKIPVDPETGIEDKLYFFYDSVGEYDISVVNSGVLVAEVPVQREYTFDGEVRKNFFTFPSTTLPESLSVILNYVKKNLPLVSASDDRLFFYGNSDLVKNYLTLKGIDPSVVDVDSNTDFEMAFIGILEGDEFVFHGFSKSRKQLVLQIPNLESDMPFYTATPLTIVSEGADIEVPEADVEPIEVSASCEKTLEYTALESSLEGIRGIFAAGRTMVVKVNGEKYSAVIEETNGVPESLIATVILGDDKELSISLTNWTESPEDNQLILGANFVSESTISVDFKSITEEEYVPMDSRFIPSTTSITESSTDEEFPTAKTVWNAIKGGILYKGTVASESDLPANPSNGWMYIASAAFTMTGGQKVEINDELFWAEDTSSWNIIQGNTDGVVIGPASATDGHLAVFDGATGKFVRDGGAVPEVYTLDYIIAESQNKISGTVYKNSNQCINSTFYLVVKATNGTSSSYDTFTLTTDNDGKFTVTGIQFFNDGSTVGTQVTIELYLDSAKTKCVFAQNRARLFDGAISSTSKGYVRGNQVYNYSEAKSNKTTSISDQSTDTQYPSALAVKNYVDTNGFNPANMELVTDPVTLNTPQADWNQADSTAQDYIKNKPTVPDVWTISHIYAPSIAEVRFKVFKNGVEYTSPIKYRAYSVGESSGGTGYSNISHSLSYDTTEQAYVTNFGSNVKYVCKVTLEIWNDSDTGIIASECISFFPKATTIANGDSGYATGDQVYGYVSTQIGNIETLLASI